MKQEILDLIRANPNIRTVEIADKLDMEPDSVRPLIADEIRLYMIVEEPIIAPNGREVLSFRFRDAQPKAAIVTEPPPQQLPARVLRALPPTKRPAPTPAPAPAAQAAEQAPVALEIDVPVTRKEGVPLVAAQAPAPVGSGYRRADGQLTRVEKALECLRKADGPVDTDVLARAMGLPEKHHPSSYLRDALKRGIILMRSRKWYLGTVAEKPAAPAAVEVPAPVVKPRAKKAAAVSESINFPRADPEVLAAYAPGSKRCTMNCGPHVDDPRSDAERAVLCDDCETVKPLGDALGETTAATGAEWVGRADPDAQVEPAAVAPVEPDAAAAWVAAAEAEPQQEPVAVADEADELLSVLSATCLPSIVGGLPVLSRPAFIPAEVEPGSAILDFSRPGVYENGVLRPCLSQPAAPAVVGMSRNAPFSTTALDAAAERFLAGVMSDGSLHLRIPGKEPFDLEPAHARALWEMMRLHGYAAWKTAA